MSKCKRERTPKQATAGGGRAIGLDPVYTDKFLNGQIVYLCNPLTTNPTNSVTFLHKSNQMQISKCIKCPGN